MCAEHRTGGPGLQDHPAEMDGQASRGSEGSQGLPACGQASKALKETQGTLGPLESLATWAFLGPVAPWGSLASQD